MLFRLNHILELFERNFLSLKEDDILKDFRIILVNDGSTSKNYQQAISKFQNLFQEAILFVDLSENKGKGGAIKEGMKHSTAEMLIFYDIDFPFGKEALYEMYHLLKNEKSDVIIAKRVASYYQKLPWKRKVLSKIVKSIAFLVSKGKIKDSQAGLKGLRKSSVPLLLSTKCNSFIMDFEFLLKASQQNLIMDSLWVTPNNDIEFTDFSNKIVIKEIKNMFKILFYKS